MTLEILSEYPITHPMNDTIRHFEILADKLAALINSGQFVSDKYQII